MRITRRDVLRRGLVFGAAALGTQGATLRTVFAGEGGGARRLVFVELDGGNDGLNTIVPHALDGGVYHALYRPQLGIAAESLIPLTSEIGFHPKLKPLMGLWNASRLAVIQGVGSPLPTFSHDFAKKVWASGDPTGESTTGWFGRYLATLPQSKARAFDVASYADPMFAGAKQFVPAFEGLSSISFPIDGMHPDDGWAREKAFLAMHAGLADDASAIGPVAATGARLLDVIDEYSDVKSISHAGKYPKHGLSDALKLVVKLAKSKLGLRHFHVTFDGFDTHASQDQGFSHDQKLDVLARALAAFHADLVSQKLAANTVIVVYSEFGRSVYENASRGTDHGTAAPVLVLGDRVVGGLFRDHPSLAPDALSSNREMIATTDYRDVLGTIAMRWLGVDAGQLFPGYVATDLGFLA
jgi:uncharacterized protein (DUF1501 family)